MCFHHLLSTPAPEALNGFSSLTLRTPATSWFLLIGTHWIVIDLVHTDAMTMLIHSDFDSTSPEINGIATYIASALGLPSSAIHKQKQAVTTDPNLCGWTLLFRIFIRHGINLPSPCFDFNAVVARHPHAALIFDSLTNAIQTWTANSQDKNLICFAHQARVIFVLRLLEGRVYTHVEAGGAKENQQPDVQMSGQPSGAAPSNAKDPIWENDPWSRRPKATQTRWEDLVLPADHPFQGDDGKPVTQLHRVQAADVKTGIVLATKSSLTDILKISPKGIFGILLPITDISHFGTATANVQGPFEVILQDTNLSCEYKRLVQLLTLQGTIQFKLPAPSCKFTADEHVEVVLELDNRILSAKEFDSAREQPMPTFKKLLATVLGADAETTSTYGFRPNRHPSAGKNDSQLQCVAQIPKKCRATMLSASGQHGLLVRDYLDRGASSTDLSVLPRFWEPSVKNLAETMILTKQATGVAGVILAKRGLAIRCWNVQIAQVRKVVMANDNRLTPENMDTVPRYIFDATGWPPATEAKHVVQAVHNATSLAPVPMRAFRSAGVHGWSVAFCTKPKVLRFGVEINARQYQILLSEAKTAHPTSLVLHPHLLIPRCSEMLMMSVSPSLRTA